MDRIMLFLRAYPALLALAAFVMIAGGVLGGLAFTMARAGLSLRPIGFIAVFIAIVVIPQIIYHVLVARGVAPLLTWTPSVQDPSHLEESSGTAVSSERFVHPETVFGPGYDPDLLSDVRRLFEPFHPSAAQMAIFRNGETAVVASFASSEVAYQARRHYAALMGHPKPPLSPDGKMDLGRASGDVVRLFVAGRVLFAWTGADRAALERRMKASSQGWKTNASAATVATDPRVARGWKIMAAVLPLLVIGTALWFFKGASWAATIEPRNHVALASPVTDLRARLLEIGKLRQPLTVTPGDQPSEVVVSWRADASWLTLARAAGLRRVHRLVIALDENNHVARVQEYSRQLDWSAGPGGGDLAWRREQGITFFQVQQERVYGLQLDPVSGKLKPNLSYTYTFNAQELKAPLIAAVTHAGWKWKPVIWPGPSWLRWALE